MRTVKPRRALKNMLALLLVLVFCCPGMTASHADFPTADELFEQIPEKSTLSPTGVGTTRKKALDQRRKKVLNNKRAAMMYYFLFALKHNRAS